MKIQDVMIVKSTCIQDAVETAIKIFFTGEATSYYLASIVFHDGVAISSETKVCKHSGDIGTSTTYFIPTIINSSLIRVEYCCRYENSRVNRNA